MFDLFRQSSAKTGLHAGALVYVGPVRDFAPVIETVRFNASSLEEECLPCDAQERPETPGNVVNWIRVNGVHDPELVGRLGEWFGLHPLAREDVLNTAHRPKLEELENAVFLILRFVDYRDRTVTDEQVSLVWGPEWVLTFQENERNSWDMVLDRVRKGRTRLRGSGADYLVVALLDSVVDSFYPALEQVEEEINILEDKVMGEHSEEVLHDIYRLKRVALFLQNAVSPVVELLDQLAEQETAPLEDSTYAFLRDVKDHAIHVLEAARAQREALSGLLDMYLSLAGMRMNNVMKVLTIVATIFIPLTFLAGIYGMNFQHMPELSWPWAYPALLGLMAVVAVGMLAYFFKRKWF